MKLNRLTLAAILFALMVFCSFAPSAYAQSQRFEDYSVKSIYRGKNAPAIITRDDRMFKTRLKWAIRNQRPNFAGHYIFTSWGCGASCIMFALIDARTGQIYSPGFSVCCWPYSVQTAVEFRLDSRLLVVHGQRNEEGTVGPHYYVWRNNQLEEKQ